MIYLLRKKKKIQTYQKSNYHLNLITLGSKNCSRMFVITVMSL